MIGLCDNYSAVIGSCDNFSAVIGQEMCGSQRSELPAKNFQRDVRGKAVDHFGF